MRRTVSVLLLTGVLLTGLTGCSKGSQDRKTLLQLLQKTALMSGRFQYDDKSGGVDTTVQGVVDDDYRYKSELDVNGAPTVDEVVLDDAIADVFLDPNAIPVLARRSADGQLLSPPADDAAPGANGISVINALASRRWVMDPSGAPDLFNSAAPHPIGQDPLYDARTVFAYTEQAVLQAANVSKYDSEGISPVYKTVDDPFFKPAHGAKLVRYDLTPPPLPKKTSNGGNQTVPDTPQFRKMVVFVLNGVVVRIMEQIDVTWKLAELKRNYGLTLKGDPAQQASDALSGINAVRVGQGNTAIRTRSMDFQLLDLGKSFDVALPTTALVGPLHLLVNRGQAATNGGGSGTAVPGPVTATSPTTTEAGGATTTVPATTTTKP